MEALEGIARYYGYDAPFRVPHELTWEQIWIAWNRILTRFKEEKRARSGKTRSVSPRQFAQMMGRSQGS